MNEHDDREAATETRPVSQGPQVRSATDRFKDMLTGALERCCVLEEQYERTLAIVSEQRAYIETLEQLIPEDQRGDATPGTPAKPPTKPRRATRKKSR